MDLNSFKTDRQSSEEGVWVDMGEGCSLLIARKGNNKFAKKIQALIKPYQRQIEMNSMPEDKANELLAEAMAYGILLDWKGLKLDGKEVKYSQTKAKELLNDPDLRDFRNAVDALSDDREKFRKESIEAAEKN
jgi:hypothetical protein